MQEKLIDKLVEECTENIDEEKLDGIATVENKSSSCITYIILMIVAIMICFGIVASLVYYNWSLYKFFRALGILLVKKQ